MTEPFELRAGSAAATVVPDAGGRLGALVVDGVDVIVRGDGDPSSMMWGSFPMAPYAGRVGHGRFTHDGATHHLPLSLPPHAGHGTVWDQPWQRTDDGADPSTAELRCPLGARWPLGGVAVQRLRLAADGLRCRLEVTAGDRSMPAEVGWHPWFAASGPVRLDATAMYERGADHLPTGRLVEVAPPPWDDCFVVAGPTTVPVGPLTITVDSDCDHLVVCTEFDIGIAIEPQSGPPDALRLAPRVLRPGERLVRTMEIGWSPTSLEDPVPSVAPENA